MFLWYLFQLNIETWIQFHCHSFRLNIITVTWTQFHCISIWLNIVRDFTVNHFSWILQFFGSDPLQFIKAEYRNFGWVSLLFILVEYRKLGSVPLSFISVENCNLGSVSLSFTSIWAEYCNLTGFSFTDIRLSLCTVTLAQFHCHSFHNQPVLSETDIHFILEPGTNSIGILVR